MGVSVATTVRSVNEGWRQEEDRRRKAGKVGKRQGWGSRESCLVAAWSIVMEFGLAAVRPEERAMRLVMKAVVVWRCGRVRLGGYGYLLLAYPETSARREHVGPRRRRRFSPGKYLADHVAVCTDCHSQRDWTRYAGPLKPETYGAGGEILGRERGLPGRLVARSITPSALASWTDGEIVLGGPVALTARRSFPYAQPVSWARTWPGRMRPSWRICEPPPRTQQLADRTLHFPRPLVVRTHRRPKTNLPATRPDPSQRVAYGQYLTSSGCADCHTRVDADKAPLADKRLAAARSSRCPMASSPDWPISRRTPRARLDGARSIAKFKAFSDGAAHVPVKAGDFNTPMPWQSYAGMTREDLGAIFTYRWLRTPSTRSEEGRGASGSKVTPRCPSGEARAATTYPGARLAARAR